MHGDASGESHKHQREQREIARMEQFLLFM
jgi:hypothetical protein